MEYNAANRQRKTDISWEIVQAVIDNGGRFMKKSNEEVASKSSKSKKKAKSKQQQTDNGGTIISSGKKSKAGESDGGAALQPPENEEDMWELVSYAIAREKVAHGFRTPNRGTAAASNNKGHATTAKVDAASVSGTGGQDFNSSNSKKKKQKTATRVDG